MEPSNETSQTFEDETLNRPLIGPLAPISVLREEYEHGKQTFVKQIDSLTSKKGFKGIRRTRGDGDCFYRSLAYAYVEQIMRSPDRSLAVIQSISMLDDTKKLLESVGFQELVFEDFLEAFTDVIKSVEGSSQGGSLSSEALLEYFNSPEVSNSIVVYLRLLTSARIRIEPDEYMAFLFHPETGEQISVRDFCEKFVEPVGQEADHVQMMALTKALLVNIKIAYLDGRSDEVSFVDFESNSGAEPITLLYRPGHYDILDQRTED